MSNALDFVSQFPDSVPNSIDGGSSGFEGLSEKLTVRHRSFLEDVIDQNIDEKADCVGTFVVKGKLADVNLRLATSNGPYCFGITGLSNNSSLASSERGKNVGDEVTLTMNPECSTRIRPNNLLTAQLDDAGNTTLYITPGAKLCNGTTRVLKDLKNGRVTKVKDKFESFVNDLEQNEFVRMMYRGPEGFRREFEETVSPYYKGLKCSDFSVSGPRSADQAEKVSSERLDEWNRRKVDMTERAEWELNELQKGGFESFCSAYAAPEYTDDLNAIRRMKEAVDTRIEFSERSKAMGGQTEEMKNSLLAANAVIGEFMKRPHLGKELSATLENKLAISRRWDSEALRHVSDPIDAVGMAQWVEKTCDQPSITGVSKVVAKIIELIQPHLPGNTKASELESAKRELAELCTKSYLAQRISEALDHQIDSSLPRRTRWHGFEPKDLNLDEIVVAAMGFATGTAAAKHFVMVITERDLIPPGVESRNQARLLAKGAVRVSEMARINLREHEYFKPQIPFTWTTEATLLESRALEDSTYGQEFQMVSTEDSSRATHLHCEFDLTASNDNLRKSDDLLMETFGKPLYLAQLPDSCLEIIRDANAGSLGETSLAPLPLTEPDTARTADVH